MDFDEDDRKRENDLLADAIDGKAPDLLMVYYYRYFTETYEKANIPSNDDVLYIQNPGSTQYVKEYDGNYLSPNFVAFTDELTFTDTDTNEVFLDLYNQEMEELEFNLQSFKFAVVVYDENEMFPKSIRHPNFYYPYQD